MAKLDMLDSWSVRIDVDALTPNGGRTYRKHVNLLVLAPTAERALAIAKEHYPDSSVWAINHANKDAVVLYDAPPIHGALAQ